MPSYDFPIPINRGIESAVCNNRFNRMQLEVTDLVYQGNGAIVTFNDCDTAVATFKVVNGEARIVGLTNAQAQALYKFNETIGDEVKQLDHRHRGAATLAELNDVELGDGPNNEDLLGYDEEAGNWIPMSPSDINSLILITEDYNLGNDEEQVKVILCDASSNQITITLTPAADSEGRLLYIKKTDSTGNLIKIDGYNNEEVDDATVANINSQYESITLFCDSSNWHIL